jgi:hypothetical protein
MLKNISFHPKLIAVADLFFGLIMFWRLKQITVWWLIIFWFVFRLLLWVGFVLLMYSPNRGMRWRHLLSLAIYNFGNLLFLLFIDWTPAWNIMAGLQLFLVFISFWILPSGDLASATLLLKQHLRWRFIMSTIGLAGIFTGISSLISFRIFYTINNWVWLVTAVILATILSIWYWLEYGIKYNQLFLNWVIIFFILSMQFLWIIIQLPLGYLVNSVLLIWHWYILWLIARFNMSPEGIKWRKQSYFLIGNAIIFLIFLFFIVRWK